MSIADGDSRGSRRRAWTVAASALAVVAAVVGLAVGTSLLRGGVGAGLSGSGIAGSGIAGAVGDRWHVRSVIKDGVTTAVPADNSANVHLLRGGEIYAGDGVNAFQGTYRLTSTGFAVDTGSVAASAGGVADDFEGPQAVVRAAVDRIFMAPGPDGGDGTSRVTAALHGETLTLAVGGYTLDLVRVLGAAPVSTDTATMCKEALGGSALWDWGPGTIAEFRTYQYGGPRATVPLAHTFPGVPGDTRGAWCGTKDGAATTHWWAVISGHAPASFMTISGPDEGVA